MGFANPAALYLLALAPALIVAYLARERPREITVSSVLALRALRTMRGERFGGRPRLSWTFFAELLALILAALALAKPYVVRRGHPIAVVLDNSAAMQAVAGGANRYTTTMAQLTDALESGAPSAVTVYALSPTPHQLGVYRGPAAALDAIKRVGLTDVPVDLTAMAALVRQLLADSRLGRVYVASSHRVESSGATRLVALGASGPLTNYAIGSFTLEGGGLGSSNLHARISAANFSPAAQTLRVEVTADGAAAGTATAHAAAGKVAVLDIPNLPAAKVYQAHLTPGDGFMLDNAAYATAATQRRISLLFVSPTPGHGESLRAIPGLAVTTRTPESFSPRDLSSADVAIFEFAVPKELPSINTLLVMPPAADPLFGFAVAPAAKIEITGWPATDRLTDGVNFLLLNVGAGEYFGQHPWMAPVVEGAGGGLLLSGARDGRRYLATGFDPLPYLGRANLPMTILTLNLLSSLAGLGAPSESFRTGEPWEIPSGVNEIILPSGHKLHVEPGSVFSGADTQGVYQMAEDGATSVRAVNLGDLAASDLESDQPLRVEAAARSGPLGGGALAADLMPLFLAIMAGIILLEAFLVYRARRTPLEV